MRSLLRCRRGSVAFATVIALVPLIGVVALGAEAGSWYVTKQHAQNAADAAAYSSGLTLGCAISASVNCDTTEDFVYRGKQLAAQNAFCNSGESYTGCATLPAGTSQKVQIDRGDYADGTWASTGSGSFVRAVVSQQQPTALAAILGLSTVNIGAQAIAEVRNPKDLCALGLGPSSPALTIGGSSKITGNGCALMSDTSVKYNSTPNLVGPGWAVDGVTGCTASAAHCDISPLPYNYNMLPATNPLQKLNAEPFNTRNGPVSKPCGGGNVTNGNICSLNQNGTTGGVYSDLTVNGGGTVKLTGGTYFFYNATLSFNGTVTNVFPDVAGGPDVVHAVTFVLLGTSSLSIGSSAIVNLSAPATNAFSSDLNGILIDDQAQSTNPNKIAVSITGGGSVKLGGVMYFPNADVTYGGTVQNANTTCAAVIGKSVTLGGNATYLSTQGCADGTVAHTQVVALVH